MKQYINNFNHKTINLTFKRTIHHMILRTIKGLNLMSFIIITFLWYSLLLPFWSLHILANVSTHPLVKHLEVRVDS